MTARILVADGVATNRITLKVRLTSACYQVETANSIAQCADQIRRARPDVIVLGHTLGAPGQTISLCQQICAEINGAPPPVILLAERGDHLAGLRAGAAAVLDPRVDEQMLLARIRGILRDRTPDTPVSGMAEQASTFDHAPAAQITLVADSAGRGLCWKHALGQRLPYRFHISDPEEALAAAASGRAADLYLIAADIDGRGDGLRLLSELRSRAASRDAAFVMATAPERAELSAIALDLGAGDVLPLGLGNSAEVEAAAIAIESQLTRKRRGDVRRAEAQRTLRWAMTDPLTGLYNRRYALPRLTEVARDALRGGRGFCVLALDLDRFKSINDRFGHSAGDAVLCDVAHRLGTAAGSAGLAARLGGEEFMIVLPSCDHRAACGLAERIRADIVARPVHLPRLSGGGAVQVTISIGVAEALCPTRAAPGQSMAEILAERALERADRALLAAKAQGRNRVMLARSEQAA